MLHPVGYVLHISQIIGLMPEQIIWIVVNKENVKWNPETTSLLAAPPE